MNIINDNQLKQLLAKLIPDVADWVSDERGLWLMDAEGNYLKNIRDTELLHLCDLAEQALTEVETMLYEDALANEHSGGFARVRYTWQQRVTALAAVKGITL
jgi:hypothetical protein